MRDVKVAYDALNILANDNSNLLGQINNLIKQMGINSVHGIGKETIAIKCTPCLDSNFTF